MHTESRHPKLLLVIDNLSTGGAQRQMVNLAIGLKKQNYTVELLCYAPGDLLAEPLKKEGIPVHWHLKRSRYAYDTILDMRRLLQKGEFDLGLSFLSTPNFYLIMACLSLRHPIPIIVSERFCDLPTGIPRNEKFVRMFYRYADHIVVNSHHQRQNFEVKYPSLKHRISTIYNGYDLQEFSPAPQEPDNHPLRLLTIASVSRYKNGACLIEALKILRDRFSLSPIVDWIGQRMLTGDRLVYLREMEQLIQSYHLEQQWNWLDQRTDIVNQLHQHDVLVHPSYGEGLPNAVCEALACARPVIISDALDHAALVKNNGLLFDYQDPGDLAKKIYNLSQLTPSDRRKMGLYGRQFAETNLSLDRFVHDYERLFDKLLTGYKDVPVQ